MAANIFARCVPPRREQATRWGLGGAAGGGAASAPDVALDYEGSLHAELRLHRADTATVTPSERTLT